MRKPPMPTIDLTLKRPRWRSTVGVRHMLRGYVHVSKAPTVSFIPSATGVLLKIKFFRKEFYHTKRSKIPVSHYLRTLNANRMSLFRRETVET
jgi:hypothetical protein